MIKQNYFIIISKIQGEVGPIGRPGKDGEPGKIGEIGNYRYFYLIINKYHTIYFEKMSTLIHLININVKKKIIQPFQNNFYYLKIRY